MMAMATMRHLGQTYTDLNESISTLASGLRINSADDDAAGLAVREIMRVEVAALGQGIRNANDAINMLQTFDGAAAVIDEKLVRMKELAMQASTGTYSGTQRSIMNDEFDQMRNELDRIAKATQFNGIYGLNSASNSITIHFGAGSSSATDFYRVQTNDMTATGLSIDGLDISSQTGAQSALTAIDTAVTNKDQARAHFGAMMNRLENTISNLSIQRENIQASESQISDADVAWEMARMSRNQVLAQAGIGMLTQANQMPMMIASLIG
jgi:flagellin